MVVLQEHLKLCEAEASECSTKLSSMEQKCSQLEKEIESKSRLVLISTIWTIVIATLTIGCFCVACIDHLSLMLLDLNQTIQNQD